MEKLDEILPRRMTRAILKTIAWLDIFEYPLTLFETWKWLPQAGVELSQVLSELEKLVKAGKLERTESFYHLPGRPETMITRKERYIIAEKKFRKALKFTRRFARVPGVRMVAVCNTLGYFNAHAEDDIDLFVITAPRRIWLARFLCLAILKLSGERPKLSRFHAHRDDRQDKIDLSFFVTTESLNIEPLAKGHPPLAKGRNEEGYNRPHPNPLLGKEREKDIYLSYWVSQLIPVYNEQDTYQKFLEANAWVKEFLPNVFPYQTSYWREVEPAGWFKRVADLSASNIDEKFYRWLQLKILPQRLKTLAKEDPKAVVISDQVLKFHDQDRRDEYHELFRKKVSEIFNF